MIPFFIMMLRGQTPRQLADEVNPFIGTGGHGHVYPGVSLPFGMVQLSPDTRVEGWDACAGYHYTDSVMLGFSHTHLSGTGIGDYGDILLMPTVGELRTERGDTLTHGYRSKFSHARERASAGSYSVTLDDYKISVELTATKRVGLHRYTFPKAEQANVILDLVHGIGPDRVLDAMVKFTSDREIVGYRRSKGWAPDQLVYFVIQSSKPFAKRGTVLGGDRRDSMEARGTSVKAFVTFSTDEHEQVLLAVALSSVDIEGARKNLQAELPQWDFDEVRTDAREEWNRALGKIEITGGTESQRKVFYTVLYRTMLAPNLFSDVDGRYRGIDKQTHNAKGYDHYTVFSLWDTFRAAHPLYTIIEQKRTVDFLNTFLSQYEQGGLLPVWELAANETWTMIGYHSVPVIADAYMKGIRGFDAEKALEAMKKSANQDHFGLGAYRRDGYISGDKEPEGVSKTLEYAYDDWTIAEMARALRKKDDAEFFSYRAQRWRNMYDPASGFFRGRRNGGWLEPFDPYAVTLDYTEANAWQYSMFVPHDVNGLIEMMGGREKFIARLDTLFTTNTSLTGRNQADISGLIGQYAHGNEPSHHMAYLYTYAGAPWKTQVLVRRIMREQYTDQPDGLSGNEDCGQMSAWYVLSAMGFYQVNPGQPMYCLGSPLFNRVTINLENGKKFAIVALNNPAENSYVRSAALNGRPLDKSYITHEDIMNGGDLVFTMSPQPNTAWASAPEDSPRSPAALPYVPVPVISAQAFSFSDSAMVTIEPMSNDAHILYATDGGHTWRPYSGPFMIYDNTIVKAMARNARDASMTAEAEFKKFRRIGTINLLTSYSPQYTAGGDDALIDGLRGLSNFRVGFWQGYWGNDLEAVIDLGAVKPIKEISATFLQENYSWIFFPQDVRYEISQDGKNYRQVFQGATGVSPEADGGIIKTVSASVQVEARYVKVTAKNLGTCPPWHSAAGSKAWLFVDEIEVR
ncbi:MAG: GH92 family glycosyl hydrolase [Ignavibacteriae bacterium]|nr:GH92 family glycosyl hydrolase [Ignavibacteriota bacterium]